MVQAYAAGSRARQGARTKQAIIRQALAAAAALIIGVLVGMAAGGATPSQPSQTLNAEIASLRQDLLKTMLMLDSSSQRLKAVASTHDEEILSAEIRDALLAALRHDPSVNVRLAVVEALSRFAGDPEVAGELEATLSSEDALIVQESIKEILHVSRDL